MTYFLLDNETLIQNLFQVHSVFVKAHLEEGVLTFMEDYKIIIITYSSQQVRHHYGYNLTFTGHFVHEHNKKRKQW